MNPLSDSLDLDNDDDEPLIQDDARQDKTPEEAVEISEDVDIARIAQILATGSLTARVESIMRQIPKDRHGCFIRERDGDIFKFKELGYRIETTATMPGVTGLHGAGDGRIRIADVILMTTSMRNKENIQKVEAALVRQKLQMAEKEYEQNAQQTNPSVPIFNEGGFHALK